MSGLGSGRSTWQDKAWEALDSVGELRYYVGWRASSCSRCRLVASDIDEVTGLPTGSTENERVAEIIRGIAGGPLGQAQLIKRAVECLTVPGEVWIAVVYTDDDDRTGPGTWLALTNDEMKTTSDGKVTVELPTGAKHVLDRNVDGLFRVWNPRPRRAKEADSPVRATMDSLNEIVRTTKTISNASKSRLIGNGVVFVPHEMSLPAVQSPVAVPLGGAGQDPNVAPLPLAGTPAVQQLQNLLLQVAQTAYDDEDSMAALVPMFAGVPGDQVKNVHHLKFDNSVTDIAIKTRNDAIARLAMGLDVTPERLLGLGSNANHWSAWQIGDDDVRLHISPPMETVCQAIYVSVIRPALISEGIDPDKYILWYDASALTADPDLTDEATNAFDRGAITAEAYRDFLGLGDAGYDFATMEGWQRWATDRVSQKPELLTSLMPLLTTVAGIEFPEAPPAIETTAPGDSDIETSPKQEPRTEDDDPAVSASVRVPATPVNDVEDAVVDLLVARALELAGKRRRTRADHERLRDVPMHETHRFMPPASEAEVSRFIDGWDAALRDSTLYAAGLDAQQIRAAVRRAAHRELTRPVVDGGAP